MSNHPNQPPVHKVVQQLRLSREAGNAMLTRGARAALAHGVANPATIGAILGRAFDATTAEIRAERLAWAREWLAEQGREHHLLNLYAYMNAGFDADCVTVELTWTLCDRDSAVLLRLALE